MSELFAFEGMLFCRILFEGLCFGFVYDVLRAVRRAFCHRRLWVAFEDFLFLCISFFQMLYLLEIYCVGNIRFFVFYGLIIGIIIYFYTISSVWIFALYHMLLVAKKCSKNIKKMLKKVAKTVNIMVNLKKYRKHEK